MVWLNDFGRGFPNVVFCNRLQRRMGSNGVGGGWKGGRWSSCILRQLHDWELGGVEAFLRNLHMTLIRGNEEDRMSWKETKSGISSVKSLLSFLS